MGIRWVVNACLIAAPIGTTLGVLFGVDASRAAHGQKAMFAVDFSSNPAGGVSGIGTDIGDNPIPPVVTGGGGDDTTTINGDKIDNRISHNRLCQKSFALFPPSKGTGYIFNPNQWNWNEGDAGSLCMDVDVFNNHTYDSPTTAPKWSVTWQYPVGPLTAPVHAFPNVQVNAKAFPLKLSALKNINLDFQWSLGIGNESSSSTNATLLLDNKVNTNVALDMFLDNDEAKSQNSTLATYEIMVWFATFGTATEAIGEKLGPVATMNLLGLDFELFFGQNSLKQTVLTWKAGAQTEAFSGDLAPLVAKILSTTHAGFPTGNTYMGEMSIGSEAFSSNVPVTLSVPRMSIDVVV